MPLFSFPEEIRRAIYTTNVVESLHMTLRKVIKTRGSFPSGGGGAGAAVPGAAECSQEMESGDELANGPESFHHALRRPDGGGLEAAGTIADRDYAPNPDAPARPAIVGEKLASGWLAE